MTSLQNAIINISGAGNSTIITGISGQVIQIISLFMHVSIGNSITLQSGPSTLLTGPMFTAPAFRFI